MVCINNLLFHPILLHASFTASMMLKKDINNTFFDKGDTFLSELIEGTL